MMSSDNEDEKFLAYKQDPRIPCKYGSKCYQKNEHHHKKYKHLPITEQTTKRFKRKTTTPRKRKTVDNGDTSNEDAGKEKVPETKLQNKIQKIEIADHVISDSSSEDVCNDSENSNNKDDGESVSLEEVKSNIDKDEKSKSEDIQEETNTIVKEATTSSETLNSNPEINDQSPVKISDQPDEAINELFLVKMPNDFYKFYDFCKSIFEKNPSSALKPVQLELVGPFDVLCGKLKHFNIADKDKFLKHWRYYYDVPEFQTVIKANTKDYLHFGYWRDEPSEMPVFVAKNKAKQDCIIEPVATNLFGLLETYLEEKQKAANPFERSSIMHLHRQLKAFAKEHSIPLQTNKDDMRHREKKVVARTFHKAGIVVPYNKKTQVGYRELAVTDKELKKIIKDIEEADPSDKVPSLAKLEEVMRLATIAADECDFGTCLELGHDLFSSGVSQVENKALQMLSIAYTHLQRDQFLAIVTSHLKDRKNTCDLSVI